MGEWDDMMWYLLCTMAPSSLNRIASSAQNRVEEVALSEKQPTRLESLWFALRSRCLQAERMLGNWLGEDAVRWSPGVSAGGDWHCIGRHTSPLYSSVEPSEFTLQAGKVHNLRQAAKWLNGVRVKAGQGWSFWAQVGRPVKQRGFVFGREVREGCVIPAVGGGLCQMSGAIYQAALEAGLEIVERHAHTRRLARSGMVPGKDATVFWNYVDLRLKASFEWYMGVKLENGQLVVEICAEDGGRHARSSPLISTSDQGGQEHERQHAAESCESCGMAGCFRHAEMAGLKAQSRTVFLVDEWWPEYDLWMLGERKEDGRDWLMLPTHAGRMGGKRYPWTVDHWGKVMDFPGFVWRRSWRSRSLARQGAVRQKAMIGFSRELSSLYEKQLPFDAVHLVVAQSLLPHLWLSGALGGRTFDVLMQRPPVDVLQQRLDGAWAAHPESRTLGDFRLEGELAEAEAEALTQASRWITPSRDLASMAGSRGVLLEWQIPSPMDIKPRSGDSLQMIFPASTLGRKGAYEVREAAKRLGWRVVLGGPVLESAGFWRGVEAIQAGADCWRYDGPVVMPVWAESQPRRLLQALANGRRVITTRSSGLAGMPGVILVDEGDSPALISAIEAAALEGALG